MTSKGQRELLKDITNKGTSPNAAEQRKVQLQMWKEQKLKEKQPKNRTQPVAPKLHNVTPTVRVAPGSRPSTTDSLEILQRDAVGQKRKSEIVATPAIKKTTSHSSAEDELAKENVFLKAQLMSREEEIQNFKFALECYQKQDLEDQQSRGQAEEENPALQKELQEQASQLKAMQRFATKILKQKEKGDKELKKKQERIETLEQHIHELSILYEIAKTDSSNEQILKNLELPTVDREATIERLKKELADKQEEINALRFGNEVLIQQFGDSRGKFVEQLQRAFQEKKQIETEMKQDSAAWNELMNNTVRSLQTEMTSALADALNKTKMLEQALGEEKEKYEKLKNSCTCTNAKVL